MAKPAAAELRSLGEAQAAFDRAQFAAAEEVLASVDPANPKAVLLRARLAFRQERFNEGMRLLLRLEPPKDAKLAAERRILLGIAYGATRDFETGLAEIDRGYEAATAAVRADADYYRALIHWMRHDNVSAEEALRKLDESDDGNDRARALILRSWVEVGRQNIDAYVGLLGRALDEFEALGERADVFQFARALSSLAHVCREMWLPEINEKLRRLAGRLPWTPDLAQDRSQILRAFGWIDALEGNMFAAFREFKEAAATASSDSWRLLSMLDRAFLAQATGERSFADDLLTEAIAFAERIEWEAVGTSERVALLVLAQLLSQVNPPEAVAYLSRFRVLSGTANTLVVSSDARTKAFMSLSGGIALAALGDTEEAERLLTDAWSTFRAFAYEWRAAMAAHHLFKITGKRQWQETAKTEIRNYPNSWLAALIRANEQNASATAHLTPAQRQVFDALCEGASTIAIAKQLGRSPNTVRNHISDIFEAFGVRSRAELLALLRKR